MNRFLLALALMIGTVGYADAQKKTFGSGDSRPPTTTSSSSQPPKRTFGSGDSKRPDTPKGKSFGSGDQKHSGTPKGKSFGSGDKKTTHPDVGGKPKGSFDGKAASAQKKEESKAAFLKGSAPAPSYVDPKGREIKIDPKDAKIQQLRGQLSEEKWRNRDLRERNFYATYYSRPVVVYHDPYSSFFWWWLLDRSIEQQALWAYNHRYSMDQMRYNDLMGRNAELAARVRALESQGVPRNVAYQPTGMSESDLMYQQDYVRAAYNPQPAPVQRTAGDSSSALWALFTILVVFGIIGLVIWVVFVIKWGK